LGSFLLLCGSYLALRLCREPVRRLRLIELTLLACLIVPWVRLVPVLPEWPLRWLPAVEKTIEPSVGFSTEALLAPDGHGSYPSPWLRARSGEEAAQREWIASVPLFLSPPPQLASTVAGLSLSQIIATLYLVAAGSVFAWWLIGIVKLVRLYRSTVAAPSEV